MKLFVPDQINKKQGYIADTEKVKSHVRRNGFLFQLMNERLMYNNSLINRRQISENTSFNFIRKNRITNQLVFLLGLPAG